jgi:hypothetical protein
MRLDPAVYRDVTTSQCIDWLTGAGFVEALAHHLDGVPAEVSFVTALWPSAAM